MALKLASPDIPHKSDVGGVLLNVEKEAAVAEGFETVVKKARAALPEAEIAGVFVRRIRRHDVPDRDRPAPDAGTPSR